jgi:sugar lactone lactonase YvrE
MSEPISIQQRRLEQAQFDDHVIELPRWTQHWQMRQDAKGVCAMKINHAVLTSTAVLTFVSAMPVFAQELTEAWRTAGFATPESVSYDPGTDALYVSNINSPDMSANGQGYISKVSLDGEVLEEKFTDGLNAPKGTAIADGRLYVAGIEELVEIDLTSGEVVNRHAAPGASFLNDPAVAADGTIYVTETMQGTIYALTDGELTQWLADPALAGANGIIVDGGVLLVATLGDMSGGFENLQPSNVKSVDIASKAVSDFGSAEPVGVLDGIERMADGVLVTDNGGGRLVWIGDDGTIEEIGQTGSGSADHEYVAERNLVIIPMLQGNEVVAYNYTP